MNYSNNNFNGFDYIKEVWGNSPNSYYQSEFEDADEDYNGNLTDSIVADYDEFEDADEDYNGNLTDSIITDYDEFEDADEDYNGNLTNSIITDYDEFENTDGNYNELEIMDDNYVEKYLDNSLNYNTKSNTEIEEFLLPEKEKNTDILKNEISNTKYESKKISMQILEKFLLLKVPVRNVQGGLVYYDGKSYCKADKETLQILLRSTLPENARFRISGMYQYREVVDYIKINPNLTLDARTFPYRKEKNYISFKNIVVDAKTLQLYKHTPKFPLFFSVNAKYKEKPLTTPIFDNFMAEISDGDKDVELLILEMLGYLCLHSNDAKVFFVLALAPDSGKSVLIEFINLLFKEECLMHIPLQDMGDKFAMTDLPYKAVNTHADLSSEKVNEVSVGVIKNLTGDVDFCYEKKFEDPKNVIHHIHIVFGTNAPIILRKQDEAFWNRMIIVPFKHSVIKSKQNKNLLTDLLEERDDIVSKAVKAVSKVIKRNYQFTIPTESQNMWMAWSKNKNVIFKTIMDNLIKITGNINDKLSAEALYQSYENKCKIQNVQKETYTSFLQYMKSDYGLEKRKSRIQERENPISCFVGITTK